MYQRSGNLTRIHDIFVSEKRQTIGTQLISRLEKEMIHLGILFLEITIPEENLEASLFLKSLDYIAKLSGNYYVFKKVL